MLYARTDTYRTRSGADSSKAVAVLREQEELLDLGLPSPWRIYVSETGERGGNVVVTVMESENISELFDRARNIAPGAASAWLEKLWEVMEPGSWVSQVWAVR